MATAKKESKKSARERHIGVLDNLKMAEERMAAPPPPFPGAKQSESAFEIPLKLIHANDQVRKKFDREKIEELANSITAQGLLQSVIVRKHPDREGEFIIVNGERRCRACQLLGKKTIRAVISQKGGETEEEQTEIKIIQLVENVQRSNLTATETIAGIGELLQSGLKQAEICAKTGMGQASVSKYAALAKARTDNPEIFVALETGTITNIEVAYTLNKLSKAHREKVSKLLATSKKIDASAVERFKLGLEEAAHDEWRREEDNRDGETTSTPESASTEGRAGYEEPIDPEKGWKHQEEKKPQEQDGDEGGEPASNIDTPTSETKTPKPKTVIQAMHEGKYVTILLKMPEKPRRNIIVRRKGGEEIEIPTEELSKFRVAEE